MDYAFSHEGRNFTPYRLMVSASAERTTGKGKRQRTRTVHYSYMGWTADQTAEPWRLAGSGTFCFPGLHAVERAAREYLALPETQQVSVRTNQDRTVYRYVKNAGGSVYGYGGHES